MAPKHSTRAVRRGHTASRTTYSRGLDSVAPPAGGLLMCGIGAILQLDDSPVPGLEARLALMNQLLEQRGPDGEGRWMHPSGHVGFAHRRLEIIDLTTGDQPMRDEGGNWIT